MSANTNDGYKIKVSSVLNPGSLNNVGQIKKKSMMNESNDLMRTVPTKFTDDSNINDSIVNNSDKKQQQIQFLKEFQKESLKKLRLKQDGRVTSVYSDIKPQPQPKLQTLDIKQERRQSVRSNFSRKSVSALQQNKQPNLPQIKQVENPYLPISNNNIGFLTAVEEFQDKKKFNSKSNQNLRSQFGKNLGEVRVGLKQSNFNLFPQSTTEKSEKIEKSLFRSALNTQSKGGTQGSTTENFEQVQEKIIYYKRNRDFQFRDNDKQHIFEELPVVGVELYVRRDPHMQGLVIRDLLKILSDKVNTLKNQLQDKSRVAKMERFLEHQTKKNLNKSLEQIIGLMEQISFLVLGDFRTNLEEIDMESSPLDLYRESYQRYLDQQDVIQKGQLIWEEKAETDKHGKKKVYFTKPIINNSKEENLVFLDNLRLYEKMTDFLRDSIDVHRIIARQHENRAFSEQICYNLLKYINLARYFVGDILERIRSFEMNFHDFENWQRLVSLRDEVEKKTHEVIPTSTHKSAIVSEEEIDQKQIEIDIQKQKKIQKKIQQKFSNVKSSFITRESKVTLNEEKFENEKKLLLESNMNLDSKKDQPVVDNRRKVKLERLGNPLNDPGFKTLIKMADKLKGFNINLQELGIV